MNPFRPVARLANCVIAQFTWPQSLFLLFARIFVGLAFFRAGLTKIRDWETTLLLFEAEHPVPLLDPVVAAWAGTAGELVLPLLLFAGIATRFGAAGLFIVNAVAVISLPDMAPAALIEHQLWGALLLMVVLWGPGRLAVDHWLARSGAGR